MKVLKFKACLRNGREFNLTPEEKAIVDQKWDMYLATKQKEKIVIAENSFLTTDIKSIEPIEYDKVNQKLGYTHWICSSCQKKVPSNKSNCICEDEINQAAYEHDFNNWKKYKEKHGEISLIAWLRDIRIPKCYGSIIKRMTPLSDDEKDLELLNSISDPLTNSNELQPI